MATPFNLPGLGFGTPFTSMSEGRRKVGGTIPSIHPRRVAQRHAQWEVEDRELMKEDRVAAQDYRQSAQDLQRAQLNMRMYQLGLGPGQASLAAGVPMTGGRTASGVAPLPFGGGVTSLPPVIGGNTGLQGSLLPDGTMSFAPPTAAAPVQTFPQLAAATPAVAAPAVSGNPYLGLQNPNSAPTLGSTSWDAYRDMGFRQDATAAQRLASGRAAVQAVQAQQAQQSPNPWTRSEVGNNIVSNTPGANVVREPGGNAALYSQYGSGTATFGQPVDKSFTTTGADGRTYKAPTLDMWKQNEIGERALGRASGFDADIARVSQPTGAASQMASKAQGRSSFLDQLELIHQNSQRKKT